VGTRNDRFAGFEQAGGSGPDESGVSGPSHLTKLSAAQAFELPALSGVIDQGIAVNRQWPARPVLAFDRCWAAPTVTVSLGVNTAVIRPTPTGLV
jgi:hypothetical protein